MNRAANKPPLSQAQRRYFIAASIIPRASPIPKQKFPKKHARRKPSAKKIKIRCAGA